MIEEKTSIMATPGTGELSSLDDSVSNLSSITPGGKSSSKKNSISMSNGIHQHTPGTSESPVNPPSKSSSVSGPTQPIPKKSQQIKTDKPRPHICTICTRAFARLEHLKRHERSHTNEKPFQCAACGRCFARRDLVLRHQQKLHSSLPNILRRGSQASTTSSKDFDNNEHIIILHNNTNANAPLPDSVSPFDDNNGHFYPKSKSIDGTNLKSEHLSTFSSPIDSHMMSPGNKANDSTTPQFRTGLFNYSKNQPNSHDNDLIPSPILLNTPRSNSIHSTHNLNINQIPLPLTGDSPDPKHKIKSSLPSHLRNSNKNHLHRVKEYRHSSFSASSATSYTNLKDEMNIQQNNVLAEAPSQVEFATPQLPAHDPNSKTLFSNLDLTTLGIDWNNIDSLDLNDSLHTYGGKSSVNLKDLQKSTQNSNASYFDSNNFLSAHQFQNPNHPHHIKGTTPFEFEMNPNEEDTSDMNGGEGGPLSATNIQLNYDSTKKKRQLGDQNSANNTPGSNHAISPSSTDSNKRAKNQNHDNNLTTNTGTPITTSTGKTTTNNSVDNGKFDSMNYSHQSLEGGDWLREIINTPYEAKFPMASHQIGFTDLNFTDSQLNLPMASSTMGHNNDSNDMDLSLNHGDEISSLFRSRQIDLVKQMNPILPHGEDLPLPSDINLDGLPGSEMNPNVHVRKEPDINVAFSIGELHSNFITEELRNRIIAVSNISKSQFPPLEDLNAYMKLYEKEFNKYFPFIHLPSLKNLKVDNFENIPLLLSMAAIGALYSYHDNNTLLLFNLSKFHIQHFFEKEITLDNLQFKKVPLMAHQCLVLHIFITMFLNEPNMIDITSRQMKSMVGLIRSTKFNKPLEQFLIPPPQILNSKDPVKIQNNFDYFIMAQSRIRTIYCFYMLQVFRTSLIGLPIPLPSSAIESGTHCANENLWRCENAQKWYNELTTHNPQNMNGRMKNIVELSNNEPVGSLIHELSNVYNFDSKLSYNNLLSLLMYIHERIQSEYLSNYKRNHNKFNIIHWKLNSKPVLEHLIKSWESFFIKNGGFLIVNNHNNYLLNSNNEFKLILPLLSLAKIRLNINVTSIMEKVLYKDWDGMNKILANLDADVDGLKSCIQHSFDILNLWIHNISIINDAKQTSLRTPVFFVTCVFVAVLLLSKYLDSIENIKTDSSGTNKLSVFDKVFWLNCEELLHKIEVVLSPQNQSNSYAEFLRKQSNGAFDSITAESFKENANIIKNLIESADTDPTPNLNSEAIIASMKSCKLSTRLVFLGIRILADAPVWPIAMGFAEALKNRATNSNI